MCIWGYTLSYEPQSTLIYVSQLVVSCMICVTKNRIKRFIHSGIVLHWLRCMIHVSMQKEAIHKRNIFLKLLTSILILCESLFYVYILSCEPFIVAFVHFILILCEIVLLIFVSILLMHL